LEGCFEFFVKIILKRRQKEEEMGKKNG